MRLKSCLLIILVPVLAIVIFIAGLWVGEVLLLSNRGRVPYKITYSSSGETSSVGEVMDLVSTSYVDHVELDSLEEEAILAIVEGLDPHTTYIPPEELERVNESMIGNFGGVGIQFYVLDDTVIVANLVKGGPSEAAGILGGDRIIMVNNDTISGVKRHSEDILKIMRGMPGTQVDMTICRRGEPSYIVKRLTRDIIPVSSITVAYMIDDTTGFIKIDNFGMHTYDEFKEGLDSLDAMGMKRLIVDLRGNEGGFLNICIKMVNEFIAEHALILYTEGEHYPRTNYTSNGKGSYLDLPLVVLIDEFSASAAEIFAGALQDNDRATIVGRRSFGKGLVQDQCDLPNGGALRLTIARYYIPSGRCIQKPYEMGEAGKDDYYKELLTRGEHGEYYQADSNKFDESQKFTTVGGRTVYGGGGIMPDIFVPADTTNYTPYLRTLVVRQVIYNYAFKFLDTHRKQILASATDWRGVKEYLKDYDLVSEVERYAKETGVEQSSSELTQPEEKLLRIMAEAYIARLLFDEDGFYPIYQEVDETLQQALELKPLTLQQH